MGWIGKITTVGAALMNECVSQNVGLVVHAVRTGTGFVGSGSDAEIKAAMAAATGLQAAAGDGSIAGQREYEDTTLIQMRVGPGESEYLMKEVGLYAKKEDTDTSVLFALFQNAEGIRVPAAATFSNYAYTVGARITFDPDAEVTIILTPGAYVTMDQVYPVGAIYLSFTNINPANYFGGTWVQIKDKFLLASGDSYAAQSEGGSATKTLQEANLPSHTHGYNDTVAAANTGSTALTIDQIPSHRHRPRVYHPRGGPAFGSDVFVPFIKSDGYAEGETNLAFGVMSDFVGGNQGHTHTISSDAKAKTTGVAGNGAPVNIMPPYLAVYMWRRIA